MSIKILTLPDLVLHKIFTYLDHVDDIDAIKILHISSAFNTDEKVLSLKLTESDKNFYDVLYTNNHEKYPYLYELDISEISFEIDQNIQLPSLKNLKKLIFDCSRVKLTNHNGIVVCLKCYKLKEVPGLPMLQLVECIKCKTMSKISDMHNDCVSLASDDSDSD